MAAHSTRARPMRIMLICGSAPPMPCGVGDYTMRLAQALADAGDEIAVLTSAGAEPPPHAGVQTLSVMPDWRLRQVGRVFRTIRRWRPDIVHLQYPAQGFTSSLLPALVPVIAFAAGVRVVRTWHEVTTWHDVRNWRGLILLALQAVVPGAFISVRPDLVQRLHPALRRLGFARKLRHVPSASTLPAITLTMTERQHRRAALLDGAQRLIMFFGFINPVKGVGHVLSAADPRRDRVVFVGGYDPASPIAARLVAAVAEPPWAGRVTLTGFVPPAEAAGLIAVADAVLLPFQDGSGDWNTSLQAAIAQGTLTITTTRGTPAYDEVDNVVRVAIDDVKAMRAALDDYAGRRVAPGPDRSWAHIARMHREIYSQMLQ